MQLLYNIAAILVVMLIIPVFLIRSIRERGFVERIRQCLGIIPEATIEKVAKKLYMGTRRFRGGSGGGQPAHQGVSSGVS